MSPPGTAHRRHGTGRRPHLPQAGMARRILPLTVAVVIVAGCSGGASETTTTTSTSTTTTTMIPSMYDILPGTPPGELAGFTAAFMMQLTDANDVLLVRTTGEGTWTKDGFSCTVATDTGDIATSDQLVSSQDAIWFATADGYEATTPTDTVAENLLIACPTSPPFWEAYEYYSQLAFLPSDPDTVNGIAARRVDLSSLTEAPENADSATMVVWLPEEGQYLLAMVHQIEFTSVAGLEEWFLDEFVTDPSAAGPYLYTLRFALDHLDDPSLTVDLPG